MRGVGEMWRLFLVLIALAIVDCSCNSESEAAKGSTQSFLDGNWQQTAERGQQWAAEDPENPVPHALLNIAYLKLQARDAMRSELKLAYGSSDRVAKVQAWASSLVLAHQDNPRAYLLKGLVAEISGDNEAAIDAYRKSTTVDPSFKQGFESLGNLYLANHRPDEALATYSALLVHDPNYAAAYDHIATVYVVKGEMRQAVLNLEKAITLDPNDVAAQYNLASAYLETGATEKAILALNKVVQLDPTGETGRDAKRRLARLGK